MRPASLLATVEIINYIALENYKNIVVLRFVITVLAYGATGAALAAVPRFSDQTTESGLAFVHQQTLTHRAGPMTGGGAVGDFNGDGYPDLFVLGGGDRADALYINQRDGTFADRAVDWGVAARHRGTGCTVGDYDDDGDDDLFVTSLGSMDDVLPSAGQHRLYRNDGGAFIDMATAAGVNASAASPDGFGAAFGDYDLDGDLDLYVSGWFVEGSAGARGSRLFRNAGDGTFDDVTETAGLAARSTQAFGGIFADMNGDRFPELLVAGDYGTTRYYRNNRDGTYTDIDPGTGAASLSGADPDWSIGKAHNGMGHAVADFDGDGRLDWFVTAIWPAFHFESPHWGNGLYLNLGRHRLVESGAAAGVADGGWGWGVAAADIDHDGRIDLLMTNGWPEADAMTGESFDNEAAYLFMNRGDDAFEEMARVAGIDHRQQGRSLMTLDYDRDGDLDVVILSHNDVARLYRNDLITADGAPGDAHWLSVRLDTRGRPDLAPDGIGARLRLRAGSRVHHAWVTGGGTYLGQSELLTHVGLGTANHVDRIMVVWSDGTRSVRRNVTANRQLVIRAPRRAVGSTAGAVRPTEPATMSKGREPGQTTGENR